MQNNMTSNWNNAGNVQQTQSQAARPMQANSGIANSSGINNNLAGQIEAINAQQLALQEQIRQSELNLSAQHNVPIFSFSTICQ